MTECRTDGTSAFNTRTVQRRLLLDPARGKERLMEIQQHDGVVVDVAGLLQGFAELLREREREVLQGRREAPKAVCSCPPSPLLYRPLGGCAGPGRWDLLGPAPPLDPYIKWGREGSSTQAVAPPSPSRDTSPSSRSAWRSPVGIPLLPPPRRRAARSPSTSPPLARSRRRRRHCSVRVLNAEVPSVRR